MDVYTPPELTDMKVCYGAAGGSGRRTLRMYQERFPSRNHPYHTMFARFYQRLLEDGSLRPRCIGGRSRTPAFEEVLERVGNDPSTSTHAISHAMGSNQSSVRVILARTKPPCIPPPESTNSGPNDFAPRVRFVQ